MLRLDRVLSSAVYYPANYGFIPQTMAEDDDPLDILVFCAETIPPMCICDVRVVGMMTMIDDGDPDHKIIGVIHNGPEFSHYKAASEFPPHTFKMLQAVLRGLQDARGEGGGGGRDPPARPGARGDRGLDEAVQRRCGSGAS
jgi:inorganic pyrophosphatase